MFDHMEHILSSLDMFAGIAENLIDYTFNVSHLVDSVCYVDATPDFEQLASYEMNEVMYVDVLLTRKNALTSSLKASINSRNNHFPPPYLLIWVLCKSFLKPHQHTFPRLIRFTFLFRV